MPRFHYTAANEDDQTVEGDLVAENRYVAVAQLLQAGLHITEIQEIDEVPVDDPTVAVTRSKTENVALGGDRQLAVVDGMAEVVRGGLPLAAGLRALASELPSRRARRAIATISNRLEQGISIDEAVEGQVSIVPRHLQVLLRAGLHTGRLAELLEHYLHFARTSLDTRRRNVVSLFYPLLLLLVTMMIAGALLTLMVPPFEAIFNDFGMQLPEFTLAVLWISKAIAGWRLAIVPAVFVVLAAGWIVVGRVAGPLQRKWLYYVPALGRMVRLSAISRFCHLLAIGLDHRVPLPEALRLAGSGTGDAYIGRATGRMATDVEQGRSLGQAASAHRMVPEVAHVFEWEDRDDAFSDVLRATGDICAAQARVQSGLAGVLIEPLAILGVALIVGSVVIALMLPMIKLMNSLV